MDPEQPVPLSHSPWPILPAQGPTQRPSRSPPRNLGEPHSSLHLVTDLFYSNPCPSASPTEQGSAVSPVHPESRPDPHLSEPLVTGLQTVDPTVDVTTAT